jgi:choline dehydrogenase-like flavoprotein
MTSNNHYDVIIIGSGAGGGTLAYKLAPSGKKILLLERGDYVPREKDNWSTRAVNLEAKYNTKEAWRDSEGKELHPHTNYFVGGNTKFYGAALFRLRKEDFGEIRHHGGMSPAWPISYDELEPYYTRPSIFITYTAIGVRIQQKPGPARLTNILQSVTNNAFSIYTTILNARDSGHFTCPGDSTRRKEHADKSMYSVQHLRWHPCLIGAKSDAQTICVDPALEHENVSLVTNAKVMRLETNGNARQVSKVIVDRNGVREEYSGDIVVVSCGAVNSAALLLRSANDSHPNGLANGSDVVGRHYMGHINSVLMALSKCPNPTIFQKTLAINDFYLGSRDCGLSDGTTSRSLAS